MDLIRGMKSIIRIIRIEIIVKVISTGYKSCGVCLRQGPKERSNSTGWKGLLLLFREV